MLHLLLLFLVLVPLVAGHGGMLWPPSWQDGEGLPIDKITTYMVHSNPPVVDPESGRSVKSIKSWLTDQAYLGGHGDQFEGVGNVTNPECKKQHFCTQKHPWASPGIAPSLGGGCGIFGGNPYGCPAGNDTRKKGSVCGQFKRPRGTFSYGSSALDMDFPQALTTTWHTGSKQDVAWVAKGGHWGGYTYRLCKIPPEGKTGITEECFAQNILKFATPYTMMRDVSGGKWTRVKQEDLTEGTFPPGSAWRHVAKIISKGDGILRKDSVSVPHDLPEGDYVISFRWDTQTEAQVWVSCGNIKIVKLPM